MKKMEIALRLLAAGMVTSALLVGGAAMAGTEAGAEPGKNQIEVSGVQCDDGSEIAFTLNAMGKSLQLPEGEGNLVAKNYTLVYSDPETGEVVEVVEYGGGEKTGQQEDLISCAGQTTTEIVGFGLVTIDFELQGFITPRG